MDSAARSASVQGRHGSGNVPQNSPRLRRTRDTEVVTELRQLTHGLHLVVDLTSIDGYQTKAVMY